MRPGFLNTCLASLYFLIASAASPRDKYREASDHLPEVVKSVSQDLSKEPSCDELRAMWRFSKRQSRAAESTNEIPTYRDPFAYNVWEDHASIRSVGGGKMRRPLVYGRLVHNGYQRPRIQEAPVPERIRGFEDIARMFGTVHMPKAHSRRKPTSIRLVGGNGLGQMQMNNAQTGSFQHLKELIQSERARELHEQKMSEESAARESALQYRRMMIQDATGLVPYSHARSRPQLDPVVNFPDVLAPSNDYYTNNYNYMQRSSYPDSLVLPRADRIFVGSVPERQILDAGGSLGSALQPLPPLLLSPAFGYSQGNTLNLRTPETPSFIDQEISRLRADDVLGQTGMVSVPPLAKRTLFYVVPQEYLEGGPAPVERDQAFSPVIVYPQPGYLVRDPQEIPLLAAEDIGYDPINVDGPSPHSNADLELVTVPDLTYETIAYDSESNGIYNREICSECVRVFANVMQSLERENVSDSGRELYVGNSTLKEKEHTIDSSDENESSNRPTTTERKIKSSRDNQGEKGRKVDGKREPHRDILFARDGRERPLIRQKPSEEINRESEMPKEEKVIMKPRENLESFAWPPQSAKSEYSGSTIADVKKTAVVVGHETLLNPRLLNSVYEGKEQKIGGNGDKEIQEGGNNEVEPSEPPIN